MILSKFYDLISHNATVELKREKDSKTLFEGSFKKIPDCYDNSTVVDFTVTSNIEFVFIIKE